MPAILFPAQKERKGAISLLCCKPDCMKAQVRAQQEPGRGTGRAAGPPRVPWQAGHRESNIPALSAAPAQPQPCTAPQRGCCVFSQAAGVFQRQQLWQRLVKHSQTHMKQLRRKAAPTGASPAAAPAHTSNCSTDPTNAHELPIAPKATRTGTQAPAEPSQMGLLTCTEPLPAETSASPGKEFCERRVGYLCYRAARRASPSPQLQSRRGIHFPAPSGPTSSPAWGNSCLLSPACAKAHTDAPFPDIM